MENGLGSVSTPNLVEKAMENVIMDSNVEEKVKVGSHESKDSEGDQNFEDSIAAEIPAISSKDAVITQNDDVDNAGVLDGSMVAHKKTDSEIDFEQFEEAVEVVDDDNQEEQPATIEDAGEVSVGIQPVDSPKVEKVSDGENVTEENEFGVVENDMSAHKKTDSETDYDKFEEAVEIPVDVDNEEDQSASIEDMGEVFVGVEPGDKPVVGEIKGKNEEDEFDRVEDDVAVSKLEDEAIKVTETSAAADDNETMKEEVVMEVDIAAVYENKEIQEDVIVEKHENGVSENDGDLEGKVAREILDNGHANVNKISVEEPESAQIVVVPVDGDSSQAEEFVETLDHAEKSEDAKEILSSFDNGHKDTKSCEDSQDAASGIEAKDNSITLNNNLEGEKNCGEIIEEFAKGPNSVHENGSHEETKDNQVGNSEEINNRDLSTPISDHHLTNGKPKSSVEEIEESPEVQKKPPVFYDVAVEKVEKTQANASGKSLNSSNADTKKDEILGSKTESDTKNTQGQNGPSEIKPKTNSTTLPARPAGLGRAAPLLETAPRVMQQNQNRANGTSHTQSQIVDDLPNGEADENDETREKLQMIRVKFLRLAHRLGQTPHNVVVAQVLYRLGLAEQLRGRNGSRVAGFSFDRASAMAEQLEAAGQEPLDFSCTIMVLGKSGVGKSATINSIFDEVKFSTDAFQNGTKKVQDVVGTVQGIKVRVIDTPGLLSSWSDQRQNEKILLSVKRFIKKTPPDIVLYLDRLDLQTRDLGDMPLLRTITDVFGPSIWFNAIVVLTHAASAPPEGANGTATSYDMFVTNRSHVVQQAIRQAAGDMRLMNPVSLVENHSACRKNRAGQRVLPNGQVWKPHLLLLSFASKILAEANTLLKLQDSPPGRPFGIRTRAPPLPYLLSSLLQSRPQLKLPEEQFGDDEMLDDDIDTSSDSDDESAEYDELPSFKRLTKEQIGKLIKEQKKAYFAELEYREKLFMKKQLKEEKKRRKMMKKMAETATNEIRDEYGDGAEEESGGVASVPVPMPDLALPASFDSDNPTHRYRYLDSPNQWVVRPVLDSHGWDHDIGYEGVNVEKLFVVKEKIPMSFSGQITKDKKDANMQMEINSSIKHGEGKGTSLGLDMQSLGKDMAYTLRSETKFINFKKNKATAGLSVTKLGDTVSAGVKIEDQIVVNKRLRLVASAGAMTGRGDMAYGGTFEATLRDKDHPLGRSLSTLGLTVMDWHGDLAIGGNIQSQIPVGRSTNLIARANVTNKGSGQISVRLNSSEQLQIVLIALVPLIRKALGHFQLSQFGQ